VDQQTDKLDQIAVWNVLLKLYLTLLAVEVAGASENVRCDSGWTEIVAALFLIKQELPVILIGEGAQKQTEQCWLVALAPLWRPSSKCK
jgi:hypothetical protein